MSLFFKMALLLFPLSSAIASYRLYKLKITYLNEYGQIERTEVKFSTLDPDQYSSFNAGDFKLEVQMLDTWYCPGDTSHRAYCKKPIVKTNGKELIPYNRQPIIP